VSGGSRDSERNDQRDDRPADRPSIVGWVIENGKMTIAEPGKDRRHYKDAEKGLLLKSKLILCFPLLLKNGTVYGAVELIDTSSGGTG